jgi:hypothetical protein
MRESGPIDEAPDETWSGVGAALSNGLRSLPGGSSLAQLLAEHREVRNCKDLPKLTIDSILIWADAYHKRTGQWPKLASGPIDAATDENWRKVDNALRIGLRGLPGESSLTRLIKDHRHTLAT